MKKFILFTFVVVLCTTACNKAPTFDPAAQAAADDAAIQAYIKANNITATKDPSGLYYQIITQGTGNYPIATSTVTINYTGKLLNGTVFDQTTTNSATYPLANLITGWQIGLPYCRTGGRILLLIPSALGYGNTAVGSIPPSSPLVFTIDLLSFK